MTRTARNRPRRTAVIPTVVLVVLLIGVGLLVLRGSPDRAVLGGDLPTTTTTTTTTTTEGTTTTTEPPLPGRFLSEHGWSFQPDRGWGASTDDPSKDIVVWITPSDSFVSIQTTVNEEGFVVTPRSVRSGLADYFGDAFDITGTVEAEEVELAGDWALRGTAEQDDRAVIAWVTVRGSVTHVIALHGPRDAVGHDEAAFEAAVHDIRFD